MIISKEEFRAVDDAFNNAIQSIKSLEDILKKYGYKPKYDEEFEYMKNRCREILNEAEC